MSNFKDSNKFKKHDDYYTRKSTWELIKDYIPKDKVIFEGCMLNSRMSQSKKHLADMGFDVVGDINIDFLNEEQHPKNYDIIITNPPFDTEIKKKIMKKLVKLDKPFILLMNSLNVYTKYFMEIFGDLDIKFITPAVKIHYDKYQDHKLVKGKDKTSFYSVFITYKILDKNVWVHNKKK
tara:strand:- start:165 stop:701 length:537 start_codon:yes stop_codon:yes gene_type:complete